MTDKDVHTFGSSVAGQSNMSFQRAFGLQVCERDRPTRCRWLDWSQEKPIWSERVACQRWSCWCSAFVTVNNSPPKKTKTALMWFVVESSCRLQHLYTPCDSSASRAPAWRLHTVLKVALECQSAPTGWHLALLVDVVPEVSGQIGNNSDKWKEQTKRHEEAAVIHFNIKQIDKKINFIDPCGTIPAGNSCIFWIHVQSRMHFIFSSFSLYYLQFHTQMSWLTLWPTLHRYCFSVVYHTSIIWENPHFLCLHSSVFIMLFCFLWDEKFRF